MAAAITEVLEEESLVTQILQFVSNVPDFHSCAISCRRFNAILKKDYTWKCCRGKLDTSLAGETNRERATRHYEASEHCRYRVALKEIRNHQAGEHYKKDNNDNEQLYLEKNYILKTLGTEGWANLVTACGGSGFYFRRDTLLTIAQLVQDNLVDDFLMSASCLMVHRGSTIAQEQDIRLAIKLRSSPLLAININLERLQCAAIEENSALVTPLRVIVNHFTKLAGIPEIDSSAVEHVWKFMIELIQLLIWYVEIEFGYPREIEKFRQVDIERAASSLGLLRDRVYGVSSSDREESSSESERRDERVESSEDDYGSMSDSEESCADDMSIYSDDDCPDKKRGAPCMNSPTNTST